VNLFLDTSALVKYFHAEPGSEQVTALIQDDFNTIWLSELARIEFCSVLFTLFRTRQLDEQQLAMALAGFDDALSDFHIQALNPLIAEEAERLLRKYGKREDLQTRGLLHLASFSLLAEQDWYFVVVDSVLCHIALNEGFAVKSIKIS